MGYFLPTTDDVRPRTRKTATSGTAKAVSGYRFYSPEVGRWTCRDPILGLRLSGGLSIYTIVRNDLINDSDYLGLLDDNTKYGTCSALKTLIETPYSGIVPSGDPLLDNVRKWLSAHHCKCSITCYECGKCPSSMGNSSGDAIDSWYSKSSCNVRVCPENIKNSSGVIETFTHELIHCAQYCGGTERKDCKGDVCNEISAYYGSNPLISDKVLKDLAISSATLFCKGTPNETIESWFADKGWVQSCKKGGLY